MDPKLPALAASLDAGALARALTVPAGPFNRVSVVDETGSTNADVAEAAAASPAEWPDVSVMIANSQVQGRGRLDRVWEVPAGTSLISSVLLRPAQSASPGGFAATGYGWLSILAGIALCEAIAAETTASAGLKWPNDVLVGGRKVAGILAQVVPATGGLKAGGATGPAVVVGAGVNVHQSRGQLPVDTATSLALEVAGPDTLDRTALLTAYLSRFATLYAEFAQAGGDALKPLAGGASLHQRAVEKMVTLGSAVRADLPGGRILAGTAIGLDPSGALLVTDAAGTTHTVNAGDVVHVRRDGAAGGAGYA